MSKTNELPARRLSKDGSVHVTDELINTVTSIAGSGVALLGAVLLIMLAALHGDVWQVVGFSVYGFSLVNLFVFSALHHAVNGSARTNSVLRTFDYISIFVLIAGTVTPIALVLARNAVGWTVLGVVWAIAIVGIVLRSVFTQMPKHITNTFFIVLGWLPIVLLAAGVHVSIAGLLLLAGGGLVYSLGFSMYVAERPNPAPGVFGFHEIWHVLVIMAAALQYGFLFFYVLSRA